jgi:hypothetical protein
MLDILTQDTSAWCPPVRQIYDYWQSLRHRHEGLPGRQYFDPLDIPRLMSLVWMVDVVRDACAIRFRYRLLGTRQVQAMTRDFTGWWVDEAHPNFREHPYYQHFLKVARGEVSWRKGRPGFHVHADYFEMERVMLPMARDGSNVDMMLGLTAYFDRAGKQVG